MLGRRLAGTFICTRTGVYQQFVRRLISADNQQQCRPLATTPRPIPNENYSLLTYIWIDGTGVKLRAKTRVLPVEPRDVKELPYWHYDGSSTYQAEPGDSDLTLKPVAMCRDPFHSAKSKLVLCDVRKPDGSSATNGTRDRCAEMCEKSRNLEPWIAFEQEYTLVCRRTGKPYGWPTDAGWPAPQANFLLAQDAGEAERCSALTCVGVHCFDGLDYASPYYCGVGDGATFGRQIADAHLLACLQAGLHIGGTNAEVMPSQWEYQMGPLRPLEVADELWLSRYILERTGETFGASISLDPKPLPDWNGSGNHCNFSTKAMRQEGGLKHVKEAIEKLRLRHAEHIKVYDANGGKDNARRLNGKCESSSVDKFSSGIGDRLVSVRIPRPVAVAGKGYLEDRRPASNCDPYKVVERMLRTCCLDGD